MNEKYANVDTKDWELQFEGRPIDSLRRLKKGNYLMPMATGRVEFLAVGRPYDQAPYVFDVVYVFQMLVPDGVATW